METNSVELSSPTQETPTQETSSPKKISRKLLFILGVLVILFLISAILWKNSLDSSIDPSVVEGGKLRAVQLDVLNGAGEPKLAQQFTDYLRERGFDVVEIGNYKSQDVNQTIVVDRTGNLKAAKQVAAVLGVPENRVLQKIDRSLYLDVSVIIGKDYRHLKPFKSN